MLPDASARGSAQGIVHVMWGNLPNNPRENVALCNCSVALSGACLLQEPAWIHGLAVATHVQSHEHMVGCQAFSQLLTALLVELVMRQIQVHQLAVDTQGVREGPGCCSIVR